LQHQPDQGEYTRELIDFSQLALPQMQDTQDFNFLTQENFEESKNNGDLTDANIEATDIEAAIESIDVATRQLAEINNKKKRKRL
jgi:hypothetical protein